MKKKIKDFFEGRSRYIEYRNIKAYTVISMHLFYIFVTIFSTPSQSDNYMLYNTANTNENTRSIVTRNWNFYKFLIRWKLKSTIETIAYCMWRVYYHLSMTVILNQTEQLQDTNNHPFQIQNKPYNKGMKIQLENELDRSLLVSL